MRNQLTTKTRTLPSVLYSLTELNSSDCSMDERLAFRQRQARGDLAALLAGIPLSEVES